MKMRSLPNFLLPLLAFLFSASPRTLILPSSATKVSHHKCLNDQRSALVQLKKDVLNDSSPSVSFVENSSMKVSTWDLKSDCCTWEGVTCNPDGQVIGLNLSFSMLSGHIDSLFDLRHLQRLDLAGNNFKFSPIPYGFEKLMNLTHLNLSYSCFSDQIPEGISRLTRLKSLDLSTISFCELPPTFDDPNSNRIFNFEELHRLRLERPNLQSFLQNLSALKVLYLDNVDLSAQGSNWSEALSHALPKLQVLSLSHCRLSGPIHPSFAGLRSLFYIRVDYNTLSSEVPILIEHFSSLQVLNLASCELHGEFPENVFLLPNLKSIDISRNPLLAGQFPEFPVHNSLQLMSLYETNFHGKLPESIGNLKFLETLLLYTCNFSKIIPSSLGNLTKIVEIDISYNKFTGVLPPLHSSGVPNLKDVRLSNNLLTGPIHPSIFTLPALKTLYLNDNDFSGDLQEFSGASSSVLETLYLHGNHLSGTIPRSISELPNLVYLSLANNNFNGTVKIMRFQNLKNLTSLDLSGNNLTIHHDESTFPFPQLEELKLSRCNLTDFPMFLKEQVLLRTLNLSENRIQGLVPRWLGNSSLNELDLSQNAVDFLEPTLQGYTEHNNSYYDNYGNESFAALGKLVMRSCNVRAFPSFLKNLDSLWFLDLSDNKIDGRVPNWIWKTSLQYVNVSHNQLHAVDEFLHNVSLNSLATLDLRGNVLGRSLPRGICNLSSLSILDASRNHLKGMIPVCLGKIRNLTVLNLQMNNYRRIPPNFASASNLRSLNINGNLLEGQLPRSLANCTKLEVLDLGNNRLSDTFPFWLNELHELKVLVLRNNRLYGQIELPRREFILPNLGIIDLSSNHFTGELPEEFLHSLKAMAAVGQNKSVAKTIGDYEYYQDSVTIMSKGFEMVLVRILTIFVSLDLSNNKFHGNIPKDIGNLQSLVVLNLSRNTFGGEIPSSVADLAKLESLDLSQNELSGMIPPQLAGLTFLAVLNLSFNDLTGHIPSPPVPSERSVGDSILDWRFAVAGYACGLIIGVCLGYTFLCKGNYTKRGERNQRRRSKNRRRFHRSGR